MKKKMVLPMMLVLSMAAAPIRASETPGEAKTKKGILGAIEKLKLIAPLVDQMKDVTNLILEGLGLEATAVGFEEMYKSIKELVAELDKPAGKIDLKKALALMQRINKIGIPLIEDIKDILKTVLKPIKTVLPRKPVKLGKKTFFVDDVPGFLVDQLFMLAIGYHKLVDKIFNAFMKVKEETPTPEIIEEIKITPPGKEKVPERRVIEM